MILISKTLLIVSLSSILYQDVKSRHIDWVLCIAVAICCSVLLYSKIDVTNFFTTLKFNMVLVISFILTIYLYAKFKMRKPLNEVIGLGDIILFIVLTTTFTTISFLTIFVFSLIFSLVIHMFLHEKSAHKSVPLAGYMSLFFMISYLAQWTGIINSLYLS